MEAIVLAGGLGTRLRALVPDVPKPMAPVAGRPFLEILLNSLARKGFGRVILSLGFGADTMAAHFGSRFAGMDVVCVVEDQPLGTGGAVRLSLAHCLGDHAFVFNGDTFLDLEVAALEGHWQAHRVPIMVARQVPDTERYGRLLAKDGRVAGFTEKGLAGPGLINAGCYVLPKDSLNHWPLNTAFSLETAYFAQTVAQERVDVFETGGLFIDIGVPDDFRRAQTLLAPYA